MDTDTDIDIDVNEKLDRLLRCQKLLIGLGLNSGFLPKKGDRIP